jgi:beta-glucanase (GH16 family)
MLLSKPLCPSRRCVHLGRPAFGAKIAAISFICVLTGFIPKALGQEHPPLPGYTLVFSDEFDGNSLDLKKWKYRTGARLLSFQKPENVRVADGLLHIDLKKETAGGKDYTAGGIISHQKFEYGYYEARFRVPRAGGWHTSFWTTADKAQEIDICEQDSFNPRSYSAGVIDWSGRGGKPTQNFGRVYYEGKSVPDFSRDFHVFGCEFTPSEVRFYLDGRLTHQTDAMKFPHGPQNIWLTSLAVLWGKPDKPKRMDDAALPAEAVFDYVRFYEKKGAGKN